MSFSDILNFCSSLLKLGPHALLGGSLVANIGLALWALNLVKSKKIEKDESEKKLAVEHAKNRDQNDQFRETMSQVASHHATIRERQDTITTLTAKLHEERDLSLKTQEEIGALREDLQSRTGSERRLRNRQDYWKCLAEKSSQQISAITSSDGRIWQQAVSKPIQFRGKKDRKAKIVSVLNFKGGVGKTMLAGNIGAFLAEECKLSTLVVDLDYQTNLTRWCVDQPQLATIPDQHMFVNSLFQRVDMPLGPTR